MTHISTLEPETVSPPISHCWVGTALGILKSVDVNKCNFENYFYVGESISTVDKELTISKLIWGENTKCLYAGLSNGVVREFDTDSRLFTRQCNVTDNKSPLEGLHYFNNTIISCTSMGQLSAWSFEKDPLTIDAGTVSAMTGLSDSLTVATGGEENDLKVWDFSLHKGEETKPIFQAKNVKEDILCLRVPVFIKAITFMPSSEGKVLITGVRSHQIRQYDTRVQRRPVLCIKVGSYPVTCVEAYDQCVVVGNSVGTVQIIDLRTRISIGNLKGSSGSVRGISCHGGYIGVCGIDRFTRVYTTVGRKLVNKVYTKLEQNSILLDPVGIEKLKGEKDVVRDEDELWDELRSEARVTPPTKKMRICS